MITHAAGPAPLGWTKPRPRQPHDVTAWETADGSQRARGFFHASYKKPREGNWVLGAAMLLLTFLAVFTGTPRR
ncbi:cytochrome b N-terminal domain-containing protein [Streptomyces sp. NPDC046915]|uniref:cytochrome b N-terminal domain-containing protein n=1 Tax=Streptomyces sp. NPDC046915 TaxID=3155257 RepID=UPI0033FC7F38